MSERRAGFYWVRRSHGGDLTIAWWNGLAQGWNFAGELPAVRSIYWIESGPLEPPNNHAFEGPAPHADVFETQPTLALLARAQVEHTKAINGQLDRIVALEQQAHSHGAQRLSLLEPNTKVPASSPLGVELSNIRDRLNAIETLNDSALPIAQGLLERVDALEKHPERLGSSEKHSDKRLKDVEKRQDNQGEALNDHLIRIHSLEQRHAHQVVLLDRIATLERRASTLECTLKKFSGVIDVIRALSRA